MSYHYSGSKNFGSSDLAGVFDKGMSIFGKGEKAPPPEAPDFDDPAAAAIPTPDNLPTGPVPMDPANYIQDPGCSEGTTSAQVPCEGDCTPGEMEIDCVEDPIYTAMFEQLERELAIADQRAAKQEAAAGAREQLRVQQEAIRMQQEQNMMIAREEEEEQMKKLVVFGIGGLAVMTVVTLLIKAVIK